MGELGIVSEEYCFKNATCACRHIAISIPVYIRKLPGTDGAKDMLQ